ENFGSGLAQIFNSFIRVFLGGAMMQSQQLWPQAVPNERMLAELGGLFGALGKNTERKEEKRRSRKQTRKELRIDDPAYQRVERKDDIADESQQEGGELEAEAEAEFEEEDLVAETAEMGSIFIKVDES
ncbi:MAG TPA: hypothetical protein VFW62_03375, partial [bacterium]|nr:hypothetical protein [bacterium]